MTKTLLDGVTIGSGETEAGEVSRTANELSLDWVFYLVGDADSADVTIVWKGKPEDSHTDDPADGYPLAVEDQKNIDITAGDSFHPETRGSKTVRVEVTNNGNNPTDVTARADEYQK